MKYVVVVLNGDGESDHGITASSMGLLIKCSGLRVTIIKIDTYLNLDTSYLSPTEHGEAFILDDGTKADKNLGNYERLLGATLSGVHHVTAGKIYQSVLDKLRRRDDSGDQVVPCITDAIQDWIERVAHIPVDGKEGPPDVCLIELGGTIGDINSMPFIQALRIFSKRVGASNFCLVHLSPVPAANVVGEQPLDDNEKEKLDPFWQIPGKNIINIIYDAPNIWFSPLLLRDRKAHEAVFEVLNLTYMVQEPNLEEWISRAISYPLLHELVHIALVGDYACPSDFYLSVKTALEHASVSCQIKVIVDWISASNLEDATKEENPGDYNKAWELLKRANGILVPGGTGGKGVQGKLIAVEYARKKRIPFLGICLGMQIAVIEYARSVLGVNDANSIEFDPNTESPYVIVMPEVLKTKAKCHGSRKTYFQTMDCKSAKLYDCKSIDERHRHGYEVNPDFVTDLENSGLSFTGKDVSRQHMEIVELPDHPYFIGVQFHPEFKSRPGSPSPLFKGLIEAAYVRPDAGLGHSPKHSPKRSPTPSPKRGGCKTSAMKPCQNMTSVSYIA